MPSAFLGAAAAYSLRIPSGSTYTGPLILARRSSDNAELAFGASATADANGDRWLDTTALLAWTGVNSAVVKTWYDQSGNGRDAVQTTAADQPRIVNAGVLETVRSQPAITPLSTSRLLTTASFGVLSANVVIGPCTLPSAIYPGLIVSSQRTTSMAIAGAQPANTIGGSPITASLWVDGTIYGTITPYQNYLLGLSLANTISHIITQTNASTAAGQINLLNDTGTGGWSNRYWRGSVSEITLWGTAITESQRVLVEASQSRAFSIVQAVTNGDFSSETGWLTSTYWSVTGGKAVLNYPGGAGNQVLQQLITIPAGATAALSFTVDAISAAGALSYVRIGTSSTGVGTVDLLPAFGARPLGLNLATFTNTLGTSAVYVKFATDTNARTATIDNVSVVIS